MPNIATKCWQRQLVSVGPNIDVAAAGILSQTVFVLLRSFQRSVQDFELLGPADAAAVHMQQARSERRGDSWPRS